MIVDVKEVSIKYIVGDFRDIGLKDFVVHKIKRDFKVQEFWAVNNVSFSLEKGDFLGIIGTNGAGKSTLLKTISGIMRPSKGNYRMDGKISALLELGTGFDPDLTLRENIFLRGALLGYTKPFMVEKCEEILEFAELKEYESRKYKQLSSGMKSRLAFSIACFVNPDILILDEVLSVGDGSFRTKSEKKMFDIIKGGATTLFVSHSMPQVKRLCNKVLWLHKGEQIAFGPTAVILPVYEKFLRDGVLPEKDAIAELIEKAKKPAASAKPAPAAQPAAKPAAPAAPAAKPVPVKPVPVSPKPRETTEKKENGGKALGTTKICTFGSCVTRDVFNHAFPGRYDVVLRVGFNPISSFMLSDSVEIPEGVLQFEAQTSNFYQKTIRNQFLSNIPEQLVASKADYLVLDLSEEFMKQYIVDYQDKKVRLVDFGANAKGDWFPQVKHQLAEMSDTDELSLQVIPSRQMAYDELKQAYQAFVQKIVKSEENPEGYEPHQIILMECYQAKSYLTDEGKLRSFHSTWNIDTTNDFLKPLYKLFQELVPGCHIIRFPEFTISNYHHVWGVNPRHYDDATYRYFATAIDIITGHTPFLSTPEKLWKQRSLENRLAERLTHCSAVYEVMPLKKKLEEAEGKIAELQEIVSKQQAMMEQLCKKLEDK